MNEESIKRAILSIPWPVRILLSPVILVVGIVLIVVAGVGYLILQAAGAFDIMFTDRERYKWMFAQQSHIKPARR